MSKISAKFDRGQPLQGSQMQVGWVKIGNFRQIAGYISKTVQDRRCLLYTSDAADEEDSVDLGGISRRSLASEN